MIHEDGWIPRAMTRAGYCGILNPHLEVRRSLPTESAGMAILDSDQI
jgi:hypothetical protein